MLTARQENILRLMVDEYVETATPVASESIASKRELGVSPATVRKELVELEDAGYVARPHTSAGTVPLDSAYRLYVESFVAVEASRIPTSAQRSVLDELSEVEREVDDWASVAAAVLSRLVGNMAITTFPRAIEPRVRHIELVYIQDLVAMLIVVLEQARLRRQLIRLKAPVPQTDLEAASTRLRSQVIGLTRQEIENTPMALSPLEEEAIDATAEILREEDEAASSEHRVHGLRNLLAQPEFGENVRVRSILESFEDGTLAEAILSEAPSGSVVKVTIGQENEGDILWPLSVVICRYGVPGRAMGAVGAVGPTRMAYSETIAGVDFVSSAMSNLVEGASFG